MNPHILTLIEQLDHSDAKHRAEATRRIIAMGEAALPALEMTIFQMEGRKSWESLDLVYQIAGEKALPILERALELDHPLIGHKAARILEEDASPMAVQILLAVVNHANPMNQTRIITALEHLHAVNAIPQLIDLLRTTELPTLRYQLIETLVTLNATESLELIRSFKDDPNHHVRERVELAIEKMTPSHNDH